MKKIYLTILILLCIGLGIAGGVFYRSWRYAKTVVFRISTEDKYVDYDLKSAISFLQYQFEQNGYHVLPWRYQGDFYFNAADNVGVNVFIRSFDVFWDARMNKKAFNIFYLHRFVSNYAEEFRNFDYYLSSQKNLLLALSNRPDTGYLAGGAVPHKMLEPNYLYDVLYIAEQFNEDYVNYLQKNYQVKIFHGLSFGQLSDEDREKELSRARLVVYDMENTGLDDADYIPYAVYDIISYGRPIMTNYKNSLAQISQGHVYMFERPEDMINMTAHILAQGSEQLEKNARNIRHNVLLKQKNMNALSFKIK